MARAVGLYGKDDIEVWDRCRLFVCVCCCNGRADRHVPTQAMRVDYITDGVEDTRKRYGQLVYGNYVRDVVVRDGHRIFIMFHRQEVEKDQYISDTMPTWLEKFEKLLLSNGGFYGGAKFFVGESLTWADILVFDVLNIHVHMEKSALDRFPAVSIAQNLCSAFSLQLKTRDAYVGCSSSAAARIPGKDCK